MIREQIIKALECCTRTRKSFDDIPCRDCPHNECNLVGGTSERQTTGTCQWWLRKDALALIKELTEENERLESDKEFYREELLYVMGEIASMPLLPSFERGRKMEWSSFTPLGKKSKESPDDAE